MSKHRKVPRLKRAAILGASVAGATAFSVGLAIPAGAAVTNPANNNIIGSGSSTTYDMMQSIGSLFNNANSCTLSVATGTQPLDFSCPSSTGDPLALEASPSSTPENPFADVVTEEPPIGSSSGIAQLEDGPGSSHSSTVNVANNVDFARSSRNYKSTDDQGLNFVAYAADSISWFHFTAVNLNFPSTGTENKAKSASSAVKDLTQAELRDIYNGTINNWDEVGGADAPIVVFSAQENSGTQSTFKSWLGFDPTASGNDVNCAVEGTVTTGTYTAPGSSTGYSSCQGPVTIFENEDKDINISSFLSSQTSFTNSSPKWAGRGKTTATAAEGAGSTTLPVKSVLAGYEDLQITAGAHITVTDTNKTTKTESATVASVSGDTVTLTSGLTYPVAANAGVTWTGPNQAATNGEVQGDAIFFYSYGLYSHQCSLKECGGSVQDGNVPALGEIAGQEPTEANTLEGTFPITRLLYNVYVNGSDSSDADAATPATLNVVSELGFICKPQNASITDPVTGDSYLSDIQSAISENGFYPLSAGMQGGTVNSTPFDEGSVPNPASNVLDGTSYAPYDNTESAAITGGPEYASDGNPLGFCEVSTTDGNSTP